MRPSASTARVAQHRQAADVIFSQERSKRAAGQSTAWPC
jgi:hypothetical protein